MRVKKINPTPDQLSPCERAAIRYYEKYRADHFTSPTIRQTAAEIGLSASATHTLLSRLIEYGYLARFKFTHRRMRGYKVIRSVSSS